MPESRVLFSQVLNVKPVKVTTLHATKQYGGNVVTVLVLCSQLLSFQYGNHFRFLLQNFNVELVNKLGDHYFDVVINIDKRPFVMETLHRSRRASAAQIT